MVTEYGFSPRAAEKRNARRAATFVGGILIALIAGQFFVHFVGYIPHSPHSLDIIIRI